MKTKRIARTHENFKNKALKLLQIKEIPTTEVCMYLYGSKLKKSTLNQKKTGTSPLLFAEAIKIIEYYGHLADKVDDIINE